jgi:hypothetical protein
MLTVKSGLDTDMINKLKDDLNRCPLFIHVVEYLLLIFIYGIGIYIVTLS